MECKEVLINQVLQKVSDDFDYHQLQKIKLVLTIQLKEFRVERHKPARIQKRSTKC